MRTKTDEQNNPSIEGHVKAPRKRGSSSPLAERIEGLARAKLPVDKSTEGSSEVQTEERGSSAQEKHIDLMGVLRGALHEEFTVLSHTILGRVAPDPELRSDISSDIDTMLDRIDKGIAAERVAMDRLIERMVSRALR